MTPARLSECLALLHWSQRGLAALLDAHPTQVARWASGRATVPPPVAAWLESRARHAERTPPPAKPAPR